MEELTFVSDTLDPASFPKLSDAMEDVWETHPKIREVFQEWVEDPETKSQVLARACAIGAACYAVVPGFHVEDLPDAEEIFPQLQDALIETAPLYGSIKSFFNPNFPYRSLEEVTLANAITYYNDETNMTQAEIVDAVRKLGY